MTSRVSTKPGKLERQAAQFAFTTHRLWIGRFAFCLRLRRLGLGRGKRYGFCHSFAVEAARRFFSDPE